MDLIEKIRKGKIQAGEDAVMRDLENLGFSTDKEKKPKWGGMDEQKMRKAIIYETGDVKYLLISDHAARLMRWIIEIGSITSRQLSTSSDISTQNASMQLSALFNRGYLERKELVSPSGGIEYIYKSVV